MDVIMTLWFLLVVAGEVLVLREMRRMSAGDRRFAAAGGEAGRPQVAPTGRGAAGDRRSPLQAAQDQDCPGERPAIDNRPYVRGSDDWTQLDEEARREAEEEKRVREGIAAILSYDGGAGD